jgi:type II secretory pathway pseudopilin PulG
MMALSSQGLYRQQDAFTLVEVFCVMLLLGELIIAGTAGIIAMDRASRRLADYTAAMAVVEAKIHDVQAATYNPPTYPFGTNTLLLTNAASISINKAGTKLMVQGTVLTKIQIVGSGHLVTATATFQEPGLPLSVTLQALVNQYSGGQK